jgi:hypothetical protein
LLHIIFHICLTLALHFAGESHYTHATQDREHGTPHSQRVTMMDQDKDTGRGMEKGRERQHHLSPVDNSSS